MALLVKPVQLVLLVHKVLKGILAQQAPLVLLARKVIQAQLVLLVLLVLTVGIQTVMASIALKKI